MASTRRSLPDTTVISLKVALPGSIVFWHRECIESKVCAVYRATKEQRDPQFNYEK